jgi:hypothetical protein
MGTEKILQAMKELAKKSKKNKILVNRLGKKVKWQT